MKKKIVLSSKQKIASIAVTLGLFIGIPSAIAIVSPKKNIDIDSQVTYVNGESETTIGAPSDMSGYRFLDQQKAHGFVNASFGSVNDLIENKGTGMIYVGYTGCKWCQRAVPVLDKLADEKKMSIMYLNLNTQSPDDTEYEQFQVLYHKTLLKGDDGKYHLMTPLVIYVKNGEIINYHEGLVDDFEITDESSNLDDKQTNELLKIYENMIQ